MIACGVEDFASLLLDPLQNPRKTAWLLESIYRECLIAELSTNGLLFEVERFIPIEYKGKRIRGILKLDLLVEGCIVVELKAVESLHPVHQAQVITYLKLTGCPAGLLMNFNATTLKAGLRRLDHPDRYRGI